MNRQQLAILLKLLEKFSSWTEQSDAEVFKELAADPDMSKLLADHMKNHEALKAVVGWVKTKIFIAGQKL